ncbi:hypothetical protein BHM03_00036697 [Ensete ventricosum]|nr:hypothetical protein BHM03_00036697 [Ensete ventricosum]
MPLCHRDPHAVAFLSSLPLPLVSPRQHTASGRQTLDAALFLLFPATKVHPSSHILYRCNLPALSHITCSCHSPLAIPVASVAAPTAFPHCAILLLHPLAAVAFILFNRSLSRPKRHCPHLLLPSTAATPSLPSSRRPCCLYHRCPSLAIASSSMTSSPLHPPQPLLHPFAIAALFLPLLSMVISQLRSVPATTAALRFSVVVLPYRCCPAVPPPRLIVVAALKPSSAASSSVVAPSPLLPSLLTAGDTAALLSYYCR